jgi:CubicO group peptidase (beta-lactamase class C family)
MDKADIVMQSGVDQGIFPGGVLQVVADGRTVFEGAYGCADLFSRRAMTVETCFDLASLTKPLATVPVVMVLIRQGKLSLDQPCGDILPDLSGTGKGRITLRQLLNHSSGLPPWRPFFMALRCMPPERRLKALREMVTDEPLVSRPGEMSDYSDLGYMLLHWIVESVSGEALDLFLAKEIFAPLEIASLFFNRLEGRDQDTRPYAATQLCPWRQRLMAGEVDDDNAFVTGGVGGHAGLFGTADGVCRLLAALLAADHGERGQGVFDTDQVREFLHAPAQERWALGFDTPSPEKSSAGKHFPAESVGHLGFTGTSFWVHRRKKVIVVLLTNRVHPFRFNDGIKAFRPRLHDAVMESI